MSTYKSYMFETKLLFDTNWVLSCKGFEEKQEAIDWFTSWQENDISKKIIQWNCTNNEYFTDVKDSKLLEINVEQIL